MSLLDYFFAKKAPSATVAKERLQILLAHERAAGRSGPDFLPLLQKELITVVRKYVEIRDDMIRVNLTGEKANTSVLEINVEFEPSKARGVAVA
jgi:cell division topological specificity factor